MLKKLISASLVMTLIVSLFAIGVSAAPISGATTDKPNNIYEWDFEDFVNGTLPATDWRSGTKYGIPSMLAAEVAGSTVAKGNSGNDTNTYVFPTAVNEGKLYVSFDVLFNGISTTGWPEVSQSTSKYGSAAFGFHSGEYVNLDTNRKYVIAFALDDTTNKTVSAFTPGTQVNNIVNTAIKTGMAADTRYRVDWVYDFTEGRFEAYLDGERYLSTVPSGSYVFDSISAIYFKVQRGLCIDNLRIAHKPENSFTGKISNLSANGFDVSFSESVHSFTAANITGVTGATVTKNSCDSYSVAANLSGDVNVSLTNVTNFMGEALPETSASISLPDKIVSANETFNGNYEGYSTDTLVSESIAFYEGTDGKLYTYKVQPGFAASKNTDNQLALSYKGANTINYVLNEGKQAYMLGKLTVEYTAMIDSNTSMIIPSLSFGRTGYQLFKNNNQIVSFDNATSLAGNGWKNRLVKYKYVFDFDTKKVLATVEYDDTVRTLYDDAMYNFDALYSTGVLTGIKFEINVNTSGLTGNAVIDDIKISSDYFTNDSGVYVRDFKLVNDGTTSAAVSARVFNTTAENTTACLVGGVYAGYRFTDAKLDAQTVAKYSAKDLSVDLTGDANTTIFKGFIWESISALKPMGESVTSN